MPVNFEFHFFSSFRKFKFFNLTIFIFFCIVCYPEEVSCASHHCSSCGFSLWVCYPKMKKKFACLWTPVSMCFLSLFVSVLPKEEEEALTCLTPFSPHLLSVRMKKKLSIINTVLCAFNFDFITFSIFISSLFILHSLSISSPCFNFHLSSISSPWFDFISLCHCKISVCFPVKSLISSIVWCYNCLWFYKGSSSSCLCFA